MEKRKNLYFDTGDEWLNLSVKFIENFTLSFNFKSFQSLCSGFMNQIRTTSISISREESFGWSIREDTTWRVIDCYKFRLTLYPYFKRKSIKIVHA